MQRVYLGATHCALILIISDVKCVTKRIFGIGNLCILQTGTQRMIILTGLKGCYSIRNMLEEQAPVQKKILLITIYKSLNRVFVSDLNFRPQ